MTVGLGLGPTPVAGRLGLPVVVVPAPVREVGGPDQHGATHGVPQAVVVEGGRQEVKVRIGPQDEGEAQGRERRQGRVPVQDVVGDGRGGPDREHDVERGFVGDLWGSGSGAGNGPWGLAWHPLLLGSGDC